MQSQIICGKSRFSIQWIAAPSGLPHHWQRFVSPIRTWDRGGSCRGIHGNLLCPQFMVYYSFNRDPIVTERDTFIRIFKDHRSCILVLKDFGKVLKVINGAQLVWVKVVCSLWERQLLQRGTNHRCMKAVSWLIFLSNNGWRYRFSIINDVWQPPLKP